MEIFFYGGCGEVGRSCFMLRAAGQRMLIDAGMNVAAEGKGRWPLLPKGEIPRIGCVVLTHAHLDHSGYLPFLAKSGFKGKIYSTKPTRDIAQLLLSDAVKVGKIKKNSIYSEKDVKKALGLFEVLEFGKEREVLRGIRLKLLRSGHILGASQALVRAEGRTVLYSSDINTRGSTILKPAEIPGEKIDVLLMESTYGKRDAVVMPVKAAAKKLADEIRQAVLGGGRVLIPVFAVGRGQEIMLTLENYIRSACLPEISLFVDGMISKANRIHRQNVIYMREEIPRRILLADDDPFKSPYIKVPAKKDKSDVFAAKNAVILSTSGMCTGGPVMGYLKKILTDRKSKVILVGYQAEGTLGRALEEGADIVEIEGMSYRVLCGIARIQYSGHADFNGLREYEKAIGAGTVLLVHGEDAKDLAEAIGKTGRRVAVPENGKSLYMPGEEKLGREGGAIKRSGMHAKKRWKKKGKEKQFVKRPGGKR